jgi:hypothetical protein
LKSDNVGLLGFSTIQKFTVWMLAYGMLEGTRDDYLRMAGSTAIGCTYMFCIEIIKVFEKKLHAHTQCRRHGSNHGTK